ncbi:MAG: 2-oxoacid:acceptor oxidoreductase subunit alpha [Betaproteobacteria bacterium]|nr:MAG: 2-oxoacid:acceptor oxidoreductase subunit alpha [Betaproteobacteria bacterium]
MSRAKEKDKASISLVLTGSGGAGVMTAGNLLLEVAAQAGWYGLMVRSSGPQIRGGEAAALLRLAHAPVECLDDRFDVLIGIDWQNIHRFADEIPLDGASLMIGDPDQSEPPEVFVKRGARYAPLPFKQMAKAIPGSWPNMIALGLAAGLVGLPADSVKSVLQNSLKKGGGEKMAANLAAAEAGYAFAANVPAVPRLSGRAAHRAGRDARWLITGNQAAGHGAVRGGVRFCAAYPITPATEVLEWLAPALPKIGGALVQAEDELASINMIIGASYGGVPSVTATAGPGLSLMTEAIGLAVAAEVPIVVIDVMRGGPSTGIPAKSEQSDVNIALNGLHGDAPRIVVAPNSIADCVAATQWAVYLAEATQSPAIVLSDQYFGQTRAVVDPPADIGLITERLKPSATAEAYKRYAITESGISPMAIPGMPGTAYTADGLEHNERGLPSSQSGDHIRQLDKRAKKLAQFDYGARWADIEGEGELAVVTFGSCTGAAREALARAAAEGIKARLLSLRLLSPAQPERVAAALAGAKQVLVVEQNHTGQLYRYLRAEYDLPGEVKSFRHPGPLPMRPGEIHQQITAWSRL